LTELKLKVNMPRSDAEIRLFIVDSKHRGKGIGGMLIDRFLHTARDAGSTLATVYTDDKTSNWQFYEKYGFRRVGTFHDNVTSYFCNVDSTGMIYVLDLKKAQATAGQQEHSPM
jgi:ribosomal protein S18 acetylase RimI-like enzyme